ncbi:MAG: sigma 54-interacting transcriptional regulator [Victivallales bacterium]|nr:sigma 54-interacting transcriptional regulator [Victivallales bacterium]
MNTLILTDHLSHDQAYAAAAALRVFPDAELRIAGWRQVCDILEGPAHDFDCVLLLGISLLHDVTRAAMALAQLREVGCKVHYFTDDRELFAPSPLDALMAVHCNRHSLANAVISHYSLSADDLQQGQLGYARHHDAVREFIEASWDHLNTYGEELPYRQVIEALSQEGDPSGWSLSLQSLRCRWLRYGARPLVGTGDAMERLHQELGQVLPCWWQDNRIPPPILLQGEPGAALRDLAAMLQCPSLLPFSCAGGSEEMLLQAFSHAEGGTLLLEEIGALPMGLQAAVLAYLETGRLVLQGRSLEANVRLVATTHQELSPLAQSGQFLKSLWRHLQVCQFRLPPLRERLEDLEELAGELARRRGIDLPPDFLPALQGYDFPGNEEELGLLLERASLSTAEGFRRHAQSLLEEPRKAPSPAGAFPDDLESAMRLHVRAIVEKCGGNKSQAAQRLGITRTTLRKYL